jgi:hypothetical protein
MARDTVILVMGSFDGSHEFAGCISKYDFISTITMSIFRNTLYLGVN